MLINLLRGAGLDGLAAMQPGPTKPLLALRRAETRGAVRRRSGSTRSTTRATPTAGSCATASATRCCRCSPTSPTATSSRCSCARPTSLRDDDRLLDASPRRSTRPTPGPSPPPIRRSPAGPCGAGSAVGRLPAGRGDRRPGAGRGPRRRQGLRARRRPAARTSPPAPATSSSRAPSNDAGRAVTSANGMGSPWDEIGTLVASPTRYDGHPTARPVGARHHAAPLHLDPQGQAGDLRAPRRLRREPPPRPPPGGDHLDPRERVRLRDLDHPGAAQPAQLRRARRHRPGTARSTPTTLEPWLRGVLPGAPRAAARPAPR